MESSGKEGEFKFTIVESPISQVGDQVMANSFFAANQKAMMGNQEDRIREIGKRLESNVKRIEQIESEFSGRKHTNFKELKNNILRANNTQTKARNEANLGEVVTSVAQTDIKETPYKILANFVDKGNETNRKLIFERSSAIKSNARELSQEKTSTLESFLKEIGQVKRSIKQLKESCKSQNAPKAVHHTSWKKENNIKSSINYSSSKYSYTNYRDASSYKHNRSYDRFKLQDSGFAWLKNPIKIQEFVIQSSDLTDKVAQP